MSENRPVRPGADAHSPADPGAADQHVFPVSPGRLPPPPPREANDLVVTGTITAGWAIALVTVGALSAAGVLSSGERWWVWTCAAGLCMGLFGLWYVPMLKRGRERALAARRAAAPPSGRAPGQRPGDQPSADPSSESRDSGSKTVSSTETPGSSTRS